MVRTDKPLLALTAQDLMTCNVCTIAADMPLQKAAKLLSREQISGAPVIDGDGRCIGVLSATDFMRWAEKKGDAEPVHCAAPACICSDWQVVEWEFLPRDEVRWYMTPDPVTAQPSTPIQELARIMLDAHIHRVLVVDSCRHPVGIVTSTDVLAALANAGRADTLCNDYGTLTTSPPLRVNSA